MATNNRLIRPDAMNVETTYVSGPLAQPSAITLQVPGGVKVLTLGGLTKAEALAGQIAGALYDEDDFTEAEIAHDALNIAEAILSESERRKHPAEARLPHDPHNASCPLNDPETFCNPATVGLGCTCLKDRQQP